MSLTHVMRLIIVKVKKKLKIHEGHGNVFDLFIFYIESEEVEIKNCLSETTQVLLQTAIQSRN